MKKKEKCTKFLKRKRKNKIFLKYLWLFWQLLVILFLRNLCDESKIETLVHIIINFMRIWWKKKKSCSKFFWHFDQITKFSLVKIFITFIIPEINRRNFAKSGRSQNNLSISSCHISTKSNYLNNWSAEFASKWCRRCVGSCR